MGRHISSVIEQIRPRFSAVVESSINPENRLEIRSDKGGVSLTQRGGTIHLSREQAKALVKVIEGAY